MRLFANARKAATVIASAARGRQARRSYLRGFDRSFLISEIGQLRTERRRLVDAREQERGEAEHEIARFVENREHEIERHQRISNRLQQEQALVLKSLAACLTPGTIVQVQNELVRFPSPPFANEEWRPKERRWNLGPIDIQGVERLRPAFFKKAMLGSRQDVENFPESRIKELRYPDQYCMDEAHIKRWEVPRHKTTIMTSHILM